MPPFKRQGVKRDVWRVEIRRPLKGLPPVVDGLVRQAVHEVDADIVDPGVVCHPVGLDGVRRRVTSSEEAEQVVIEALDADAKPVYAGIEEMAELVGSEVSGIGLKRDFRVVLKGKGLGNGIHQRGDVAEGQVGWRATAEEHGADGRTAEQTGPQLDLRPQSGHVVGYERLDLGVRVEVAVRALRLAERDVDVEGDGRHAVSGSW